MNKEKNNVGADPVSAHTSKARQKNGITLIALVITIIVMLILVAVTISMAVNGGLFEYAGRATGEMQNALDVEQQLADGKIQIGGVWYDSIDDYLNEIPSSPVKITLSIAGEKVTTVPVPTNFDHVEGTTIDTGYVIEDEDGNEFVWVPVDKDQKITLKITSEKDVTEVKLYDPYGDEILTLANDEIETTYNNTSIDPTINGIYTAKVTTKDGTETKAITVKSLYAIDTLADWWASEEYAIFNGYASEQEMYQAWADDEGYASIEDMLQDWGGYTSIEDYELRVSAWRKDYKDGADYTESVNANGGFYVARYEAGTTTARTSGSNTATVDEILTANGTPVSKEGAYPYNNVTFNQALGLAESMYETNDSYTVSLLTGSAWDRTLGWIYETGNKSMKEIAGDSTSWGNYYNAELEITKGKYSEDWGSSYTPVSGTYKKANGSILLTTGATTRNSANNIFDLAGNIEEWTNEANSSDVRVNRGGDYGFYGNEFPASGRRDDAPDGCNSGFGFRAALYLQ